MDEADPRLGATRIRRGTSMPSDIAATEREIFHIAYPRFMRVFQDGTYNLRYRVGGYSKLWSGNDWILKREINCWLCSGDERVGMMLFMEWNILPFISDRMFVGAVDEDSAATYKFGVALISAWPLQLLLPYGTIVEFHRLWVRPDHARGVWAVAANKFIHKQFSRRAALMVLQPFPLEYEGSCSEGSPRQTALQRRTAAMMRLYAHVLNVKMVPRGTIAGDENWMWRSFKPEVPPPRRRRLSWM